MVKPRDPKIKPVVIYHRDCMDGFAAAWAAWKQFGAYATYIAARHGDPLPPDVNGRDVYVLDFSYPRERFQELLTLARSVTLLDHHKTAQEALEGLEGCHFDMKKSGCVLAWEHFHPGKPIPQGLQLIEDIDIWKKAFPHAEAFNLYLQSLPMDLEAWDTPLTDLEALEAGIKDGLAIQRYLDLKVDTVLNYSATPILVDGVKGWIANGPKMLASNLGHALAIREGTFGFVWSLNERGEIACSVRSVGAVSAEAMAVKYGGGGHFHAAKFRMNPSEFFLTFLIGLK